MSTTRTWAAIATTSIVLGTAGTLVVAQAAETPIPPDQTRQELLLDARELRDAGFVSASEKKVETYVERYGDDDLPASLRPSSSRRGFWESGLHAVGPWARTVVEIIALAVALVLLVLLTFAAARSIAKRRSRSLDVAPFTGPGADAIATSLASALREHLKCLDEDRTSTGPRLAEAADAQFTLPDSVTTAFPPAGLIAGLLSMLDRLAPRDLNKLTSTLRPIDDFKGAGVTLLLCTRRGDELGQVTIWERDFHLDELVKDAADDDGVAGRYQRLIGPAAIWLAYQDAMCFKAEEPPAGTHDWRSYAHFAVGEVAHRHGKRRLACRLYREALDIDPGNLAARLNLAWLIVLPSAGEAAPERERRGREFDAHIDAVLEAVGTDDPLWFRATYLRAVHQLHSGAFDAAKATAVTLRDALARSEAERLAALVDSMRDPVEVLVASIAVELGEQPPDPDVGPWILPTTHYNLACYFARKLRVTEGSDERAVVRLAALHHFDEAIERLGPAYIDDASRDPALEELHGDPDFERLVPEPSQPVVTV
jgi:hypothetical protein